MLEEETPLNSRYSFYTREHDPIFLDITLTEYFNNFWKDGSPFSYDKFLEHIGQFDIVKTKWKNNKM